MQATKLFMASRLQKYFKDVNFVYFEEKNKMKSKMLTSMNLTLSVFMHLNTFF
jgi:hypothetical protein